MYLLFPINHLETSPKHQRFQSREWLGHCDTAASFKKHTRPLQNQGLPSGIFIIAIEDGPFLVDLWMKICDFPQVC